MDDLDVYRCAQLLIQEHGQQALTRATLRCCELQGAGDRQGVAAWERIMSAIRVLRRTERQPSEALQ